MVSDTLIMVAAVASLLGGVFLASRRPNAVRPLFEFVESIRLLGGLIFIILASWFALSSGVAWMVILALALLAFVGAYLVFEQPFAEIR